MKLLILTVKSWNLENAEKMKTDYANEHEIEIISSVTALTGQYLECFNPDYIFLPHWPYILPEEIYNQYICIVFHMTDLPFGRGGSPLQNLIARGIYETKISAIRVSKGIDSGPVYLKRDFSLRHGSADSLLRKTSDIIFKEMIPFILDNHPEPCVQIGKPVVFSRRKPEESELLPNMSYSQLYDHIRMLDGEGYPAAYIPFGEHRIYFRNAQMNQAKLTATVEFVKEGKE